jgi:CheY-like chemotaxis protein
VATKTAAVKVLIVDDNKIYRDAFRRNLMLQNYDVIEAEHTREALEKIQEQAPDIVITDLQMTTETEGLELIQQVRSGFPLLPIIMISAVGTFEEGALAQKYGAVSVISKSRIEEDIERLYSSMDQAYQQAQHNRQYYDLIQRGKSAVSGGEPVPADLSAELRQALTDNRLDPYLRDEAYNLLSHINESQLQESARSDAAASGIMPNSLNAIEQVLRGELPSYDTFAEDSKETLRIAEFLYDQQTHTPGSIYFSLIIGFSYCFAVENEAKARMAKRLQKFLTSDTTYTIVPDMMENNNQQLSIYYHQYMLLLQRNRPMDFTIDNVKQTFRRILEHQSRYKPDGLKALGIMVLTFGRTYTWTKNNKPHKVSNPLGMKGIETDQDVIRFAELLISLQHFRNPYIHPEISDLEKLSKIRLTAFECLNMTSRLQ